jgi:hypothetical protein
VHQERCALPHAMQSIGDEAEDIVEPEGRQHDFLNPRCGLADRLQRPHQRVHNGDLVAYIGSDTVGSEICRLRIRANPAFLAIQGDDLC